MDRNSDIQKIFEIADDSLQGYLGYHFYVIAMQKSFDEVKILENLPDNCIPHTVSWDRNYQKKDLVSTMTQIFEAVQSRISLIAMVSVFEGAIRKFINCLNQNNHPQTLNGNKLNAENVSYMTCIKWAYLEAKKISTKPKLHTL